MSDSGTPYSRIELAWPGKGMVSSQASDGAYHLVEPSLDQDLSCAVVVSDSGPRDPDDPLSLIAEGDRLGWLDLLRRYLPRAVRLAYMDLPRIDIDDQKSAFKGEAERRWSTWLSTIREHISAVLPLMARDGVIAVNCGDSGEPYVRLILQELLGPSNYVGTIIWQRHYAPRMIPNQRQISVTHDPIVVYAADISELRPVVLRREPSGYKDDGDPRGPSKAEHKGARKPDYTYETHVPPYRWELSAGALPPGIWRLSPMSGVIWGAPKVAGEWALEVQVSDSGGNTATKPLLIRVDEQGEPPTPSPPPWLWNGPDPSGSLRIATTSIQSAVVNKPFSTILEAKGGSPFTGTKKPGSGRYWEFAPQTLEAAILEDRASFGVRGDAIPSIKRYSSPDELEPINIQSLWLGRDRLDGTDAGVGYTQDATRHLKSLKAMDLIDETVTTSKPEGLLSRLLEIFTDPADWVLECFTSAADLSAVGTKLQRNSVNLAGVSQTDIERLEGLGLPRLESVVTGRDTSHPQEKGFPAVTDSGCLKYDGGGSILRLRLGQPIAMKTPADDFPVFSDWARSLPHEKLVNAVLTCEGYIPQESEFPHAWDLEHSRAAYVVDPKGPLTIDTISMAGSWAEQNEVPVAVYYFSSSEEVVVQPRSRLVHLRRLPMELQL